MQGVVPYGTWPDMILPVPLDVSGTWYTLSQNVSLLPAARDEDAVAPFQYRGDTSALAGATTAVYDLARQPS